MFLLTLCLIAGSLIPVCQAEYFSSVDRMEKLGDLELSLVETFRQYFSDREKEFNHYRKFIEHVRTQHSEAFKNVEDYLGNPINAFTLIKRMVIDWNQLHDSIKQSKARKVLQDLLTQLGQEMKVPGDEEMRGAVLGLARLQRMYNLTAADLAEGVINGIEYGTDLNWHDCFEIGTGMFDLRELPLAISWFEVTLALLQDIESIVDDEHKALLNTDMDSLTYKKFTLDTFEYLAMAHFDLGHTEEAIMYIDSILAISPDHHAKDTKTYMISTAAPLATADDRITRFNWYTNYTRLCRGIRVPEQVHHKLKCRLDTQNNPYFLLSPLKKEELSLNPEVVLYHGLLNDEQIEAIQLEAEDNMVRSTVVNGTGGAVSDIRVSQQAWLTYKSRVMMFVRRLLEQLTGMDMRITVAESMQVANYGIGGQYDPHYDFLGTNHDVYFSGDRIMTNMFYLADVEQGGYTAFPKANIFSRPVKGAMVRWFNLHRSLAPDYRTLHAGCPVIKGSKRIGNVWIHSGYQEFRRPCALQQDKYLSGAYA